MLTSRTRLILLVVLGLVAAMATGGAVTLWLSPGSFRPPATVPTASTQTPASSPEAGYPTRDINKGAVPHATDTGRYQQTESASRGQGTGVFINERELTPAQVQEMVQTYRYPPPRGRFWYDSRSGLYGLWGREAAGFIHPGHDFGPLPANASGGNTGVFINGRELNMTEAYYCQQIFGAVYQGRWWLDAATGNLGMEGSPVPIANLWVALQQAQGAGGKKQWGWRDGSGATMSSDGNCTMMAVPGAPVYGTSGCN